MLADPGFCGEPIVGEGVGGGDPGKRGLDKHALNEVFCLDADITPQFLVKSCVGLAVELQCLYAVLAFEGRHSTQTTTS